MIRNTHFIFGRCLYLQDCSVKINASTSLGYRDQDTAAVLLSVRDFNKRPIYTGNDTQNVINSGMFSLSSISVQVKL